MDVIKKIWYYLPANLRLFEFNSETELIPDLSLVRYQFREPRNQEKIIEGGLLRFSVSLSINSNYIKEQLKKKLSQKINIPLNKIRLEVLPIKSAEIHLYTVKGKHIISKLPEPGIAAIFSTQKVVFTVPLTKISSDFYDALISQTSAGIPFCDVNKVQRFGSSTWV